MIKPIDNLIRMIAEYKVDLINNLSLSKNASAIKYALAYKDFNITEDYNIINHQTTFKPNIKWWEHKCDNYRKQDEKFNQKIVNKIKSIEKEISNSNQNEDSIKDLKSKFDHLRKKFRNINECVNENDFNEFMKRYEGEGSSIRRGFWAGDKKMDPPTWIFDPQIPLPQPKNSPKSQKQHPKIAETREEDFH